MTYLNVPPPFHIRLHSATIRRLERHSLIEKVEPEIEYLRNLWEITKAGEQLLRANPEYLPKAGRARAIFDGQRALWQLNLGDRDPLTRRSQPIRVPRL